MRTTRLIALAAATSMLAGCGSEYTIADRGTLAASRGSTLAAVNLLPLPGQPPPDVSAHLAQALEMYQLQSRLLKQRRNKVRARRRGLATGAFGFGTAGLAGAIGEVITLDGERESQSVGVTALVALAGATVFKIGETLQEDTSSVDAKIALLDEYYDQMLTDLRRIQAGVGTGEEARDTPAQREAALQMSMVIETFIHLAEQINVKG
ncbi:MAG TPA: hypothetical protein VHE35_28985 [Kofleriaceae bacterium]|nr:hypothetical protein [Kofleriaceae bacterium]